MPLECSFEFTCGNFAGLEALASWQRTHRTAVSGLTGFDRRGVGGVFGERSVTRLAAERRVLAFALDLHDVGVAVGARFAAGVLDRPCGDLVRGSRRDSVRTARSSSGPGPLGRPRKTTRPARKTRATRTRWPGIPEQRLHGSWLCDGKSSNRLKTQHRLWIPHGPGVENGRRHADVCGRAQDVVRLRAATPSAERLSGPPRWHGEPSQQRSVDRAGAPHGAPTSGSNPIT